MDWHALSIGIAMIARNCSSSIARALQSVQGIATQIVVIDTGSTDSTPQIATRLGAEVYFHSWQNDFSHARNWSLRYLHTRWALVLDSDEELDRVSLEQSISLLEREQVGGMEVSIVSALDGTAHAEHRYTRLFRVHPAIRFCGRIHEQIAESILAAGFEIVPSPVRILHYGYQQLLPEKIARNIELLEAEILRNQGSAWHRYHLGLAYFAAGRIEQAWQLLEPLCSHGELSTEQREIATLRCAQCALVRDDILGAEQLLSFVSGDDHREGLRLFIMAGVLAAQHDFEHAAELLTLLAVRRSHLVDQQQRAVFAERLRELAASFCKRSQHRSLVPHQWEKIFR